MHTPLIRPEMASIMARAACATICAVSGWNNVSHWLTANAPKLAIAAGAAEVLAFFAIVVMTDHRGRSWARLWSAALCLLVAISWSSYTMALSIYASEHSVLAACVLALGLEIPKLVGFFAFGLSEREPADEEIEAPVADQMRQLAERLDPAERGRVMASLLATHRHAQKGLTVVN